METRDFNPRSREGSDQEPEGEEQSDGISIHAPARGATRKVQGLRLIQSISIHAPARGATNIVAATKDIYTISIHAPARGATIFTDSAATAVKFQSTLPRGERHGKINAPGWSGNFNPRSREGSDASDLYSSTVQPISIHAPARGATANITKL